MFHHWLHKMVWPKSFHAIIWKNEIWFYFIYNSHFVDWSFLIFRKVLLFHLYLLMISLVVNFWGLKFLVYNKKRLSINQSCRRWGQYFFGVNGPTNFLWMNNNFVQNFYFKNWFSFNFRSKLQATLLICNFYYNNFPKSVKIGKVKFHANNTSIALSADNPYEVKGSCNLALLEIPECWKSN